MSIPFAKLCRSVTGPPKTFSRERLRGNDFTLRQIRPPHTPTVLPNNCISVLNNSTNLDQSLHKAISRFLREKIFGLYDYLLTSTYHIT